MSDSKGPHKMAAQLRDAAAVVGHVMPAAERIIEAVQEHQDLFGARPGDSCIEKAADFIERYAEEYGGGD